jgi:putative protease
LGDRSYLLSPQDLAGLDVLPALIQAGVSCLKIEGRLKAPEYVANVTRVYRQAIDRVLGKNATTDPSDQYNLEMAFSRGLYTGWFKGIDNQALVHARFGKKRGVYLGEVSQIHGDKIRLKLEAPLKLGDGVVFDCGHPDAPEEGGRIYAIDPAGKDVWITFGRDRLNFRRIHIGDKLWKTSDPELDRHLRQTYEGDTPKFQQPISMEIHGSEGTVLTAIARDPQGHIVQVESEIPLSAAHTQPLTTEKLEAQLGRLGNTPFKLSTLTNALEGDVMIPVSALNRLRREIVMQMEERRSRPQHWILNANATAQDLLPKQSVPSFSKPELIVLVRKLEQIQVVLNTGVNTLYCEFEDPRTYREAVEIFRQHQTTSDQTIWVAPPRITKPGEQWILEQVRRCNADGYLVRNYDHLNFFVGDRCIGDFSLNVANALTAEYFQNLGLERLTASYDLNIQQLSGLLQSCPPNWLEITIHQHMPMFHMEHCVFCAFLSEGKDFRDCGRPCETHEVKLKDRVGSEHILQADAGCRNTVFNGSAQTGAESLPHLLNAGARHFRIEFLQESPDQVEQTLRQYQQLLQGNITGTQLWRQLKLQNQLGVTRGTLAKA